jgi:outer membrane protein assembly factor BamE (lipoprotein component of BamABCDE complex)
MMRILRQLTLALTLLALAACAPRLSQENYDKITNGMTQQEVAAILGPPSESSGASLFGLSGGATTWKDEKTTISVQFVNEKVVGKQIAATPAKQ